MAGDVRGSIKDLPDEELVLLCRKDDNTAVDELISRFAPSIRRRADSFRGTIGDDLAQEGFLALLDAVRRFSPDKGASFGTFAEHCIRNRMISVFKKTGTDYEQLAEDFDREDDASVIPENIVVERESMSELYSKISKALSKLELDVFRLYISGLSYSSISGRLGVSTKVVDNAVQRMRKKLKEVLR